MNEKYFYIQAIPTYLTTVKPEVNPKIKFSTHLLEDPMTHTCICEDSHHKYLKQLSKNDVHFLSHVVFYTTAQNGYILANLGNVISHLKPWMNRINNGLQKDAKPQPEPVFTE